MDLPLFSALDRQVGGPRRSRWGVPQPPSREGAQGPPACRPSYSYREGLNLLQLVQIVLAQPSEPKLACPSRPARCWPQGAARNMHEHCYFSSLLDYLTLHTPQFSISANLPPANLSGLGVGPPVGWLDGCCIGRMSPGLAPRLPSVVLVSDCPRARPRGLPQSPAPADRTGLPQCARPRPSLCARPWDYTTRQARIMPTTVMGMSNRSIPSFRPPAGLDMSMMQA